MLTLKQVGPLKDEIDKSEFDQNDTILKRANRRLLKQQSAIIEEQRLNALFQALAITFHELNQPLTSLLGNIELLRLNEEKPEKIGQNIKRIEEAGDRLSKIVKKIQGIKNEKNSLNENIQFSPTSKKKINIISSMRTEEELKKIELSLNDFENVKIDCFQDSDEALKKIDNESVDIIFMDEGFLRTSGMQIIHQIKEKNPDIPIIVLIDENEETVSFMSIQAGADEYIYKSEIGSPSVIRAIYNAGEAVFHKKKLNFALKRLTEISPQDELTGLHQRRFFTDALDRKIAMAKRNGSMFVVGKVDIEGFNNLRTPGIREIKNNVLKDVSEIIQNNVSDGNILCRYGNECFAFILSEISMEKEQTIYSNLKNNLERHIGKYVSLPVEISVRIEMVRYNHESDHSSQEMMKRIENTGIPEKTVRNSNTAC